MRPAPASATPSQQDEKHGHAEQRRQCPHRQLLRRHRPHLAAVEKFFFYRSSNTIAVVQARGVLIMTLARFQIPTVEYPPMQIKLALAGSGHADKGEVQDAVMRELRLNERPKPDDAADALAVGLTAWFQR